MLTWFWRWWAEDRVRASQFSGPTRLHAIQHFARLPLACKHCGELHPRGQCKQLHPEPLDKTPPVS